MDNIKNGNNNQNKKIILSSTSTPIMMASTSKNQKVMKMLSENKLKRLNILTFINEKKEILFTKKAFKLEKEKIWRQIFEMMRDSGMVSPEKDWRYVRDVSFSNWRKRAQKRIKHLSANGYRLNMDECEFLISDILGQTPIRTTINGNQKTDCATKQLSKNVMNTNDLDEEVEEEDEESDEYMIDSDEEEDSMFNEMLFIPKVVINDIDGECPADSNESSIPSTTLSMNNNNVTTNLSRTNIRNPILLKTLTRTSNNEIVAKENRNKIMNSNFKSNGSINNVNNNKKEVGSVPTATSATNTNIEHGSQRLIDLEIENKLLKNRYMKLKIFKLEKTLGFDHCTEVKDLQKLY